MQLFAYIWIALILPLQLAYSQNSSPASRITLYQQKATVIFFMGGAIDVLSEIGPDILAHLRARLGNAEVKGGPRDWAENPNVCAEIASDSNRGKVILIGHSHGAHAAIATAQCLDRMGNVPVELLITLDTIYWFQINGSASQIPSNVRVNFNLFQTQSLLFRGRRNNVRTQEPLNRGIFNQELIIPVFLVNHSDLDNYALPLVNFLAQIAIEKQAACLTQPGLDRNPSQIQALEPNQYQNLEFMREQMLVPQCR